MSESRRERRDRLRRQSVQDKLAQVLSDAYSRLPDDIQTELAGSGTTLSVEGRYLVASAGGRVYAYIDRLWLHSRSTEPPNIETIAAVPDTLPEDWRTL